MTYLNANQLHILSNAYAKQGFRTGSSLFSKRDITVADVEQLYLDGYLSKNGNKYSSNRRTENALEDHGFDLDGIETIKAPKKKPAKNPEVRLREHIELSESTLSNLKDRDRIQEILLEKAKEKALAGDPWDYVRRQWPELIIKDETDLAYFRKHCKRTKNLDLRLDDTQIELIEHAFNPTVKEIAIKGSTSPGKGFATALLMNIWYSIYTDDRITIISINSSHSKRVMFAEFMTWRKKMRYQDNCDDQVEGVTDPDNQKHFVNIANPKDGEGLSGGHGAHVLFVFDEMSGIPSLLAINARKQASLIIFISNPRTLSGFFFDLYPKVEPDKNQVWVDKGIRRACLTFGGLGALNVRARRLHVLYGPPGGLEGETIDGEKFYIAEGDKVPDRFVPHVRSLIPGQMDYLKYSTIMQSPDPIERAWSGEGKFPPEDAEFQIIAPSWLKEPCGLWKKHQEEIKITALGLDLAASEKGDETVLAAGGPLGIKHIFRTKKANPMATLSWIVSVCNSLGVSLTRGDVPIAIDAIGAGGNVMASLMEQSGAIVYPIVSNAKADNTHLYCNKRAELYGVLGERLNPDSEHLEMFMIPDDEKLKEELVAHEKCFVADMIRFYATPKVKAKGQFASVQPIKEKLGRSPDSSDAVVMCYWVIRDTEFDGAVIDQFNPAKALESYRKTEDGQVIESLGDGSQHELSESDFSEAWGNSPVSVEDEVALFRKAIANQKKNGHMFDWSSMG